MGSGDWHPLVQALFALFGSIGFNVCHQGDIDDEVATPDLAHLTLVKDASSTFIFSAEMMASICCTMYQFVSIIIKINTAVTEEDVKTRKSSGSIL